MTIFGRDLIKVFKPLGEQSTYFVFSESRNEIKAKTPGGDEVIIIQVFKDATKPKELTSDESYNQAIDHAIEVVKVEYGKSGIGIQSPITSPLHGTSRGGMTEKIIKKLEALKKPSP